MGVLPCRFKEGVTARTLKLDGTETFDIVGLKDGMEPREDLTLIIHRQNGETLDLPLTLRIETPVEVEYYRHGGILPYVLRQLLEKDQRVNRSTS
jgi:aconitate hydratase